MVVRQTRVVIALIAFMASQAQVANCMNKEQLVLLREYVVPSQSGVTSLDCSSDGAELLVADATSRNSILNSSDFKVKQVLETPGPRAAFGVAGTIIVSGEERDTRDNTIRIVDRKTDTVVETIEASQTFLVDKDNGILGFRERQSQVLVLYDLTTKQRLQQWKASGRFDVPAFVSVSKQGVICIDPLDRRSIYLWLRPYDEPPIRVDTEFRSRGSHVSPDGRVVALGTKFGRVEVWDVNERKRLRNLPIDQTETGECRGLVFSPDGMYLAALLDRGTLVLWNAKDFEEIGRATAHAGLAISLAWFPDSKMIATAGYSDKAVKVWEVKKSQK